MKKISSLWSEKNEKFRTAPSDHLKKWTGKGTEKWTAKIDRKSTENGPEKLDRKNGTKNEPEKCVIPI